MKIKNAVLFLLLTTAALRLNAQLDFDMKYYGAEDGLGSYSNGLADKQGYTWFTNVARNITSINRFNGKQFSSYKCGNQMPATYYGLRTASMWRKLLVKDNDGWVWLASNKGVYQMMNGQPKLMFNRLKGLPSDSVITIAFDRENNLWIYTEAGLALARWSNGIYNLEKLPPNYSLNIKEKIKVCDKGMNNCVSVFLFADSDGTVWWGLSDKKKGNGTICRYRQSNKIDKRFSSISLNGNFTFFENIDHGVLIHDKADHYQFLDSLGQIKELGKNYSYLGKDNSDRYYFLEKINEKTYHIVRDRPKGIWNFGSGEEVFRYKQILNESKKFISVGDEVWLLSYRGANKNYVLKNESVYKFDSLYPKLPIDQTDISESDENTFWLHAWQKQSSMQIVNAQNISLAYSNVNVNGLNIEGINKLDTSLTLNVSNFNKRGNDYLFWKNGETKSIADSAPDYFSSVEKNRWFYFKASQSLMHQQANSKTEIYHGKALCNMILNTTGTACYLLNDSSLLSYYSAGNTSTFSLGSGIKAKYIYPSKNGNLYLLNARNDIFIWNPLSLGTRPKNLQGMPTGSLTSLGEFDKTLCFHKGRQAGWIVNDKVTVLDSVLFPLHFSEDGPMADCHGRLFFGGNYFSTSTKNILVFDNGKYTSYELTDSVNLGQLHFANCLDESKELVYIAGTLIYRYDKNLKRFSFIKNLGRNFGYIWDAVIFNHKLYVSGWSPYIAVIDLDKCPISYPALSFSKFRINGLDTGVHDQYTLHHSDKFLVEYIAIEKIYQAKIKYQTRLIGEDSLWRDVGSNETKEFEHTPAGHYRFEVRAMGESEIWSAPIGIDLDVKPPWYQTFWAYAGYLITIILLLRILLRLNARRLIKANELLENKVKGATLEITEQKHLIEEKNKEITDSIQYAQKIQQSLLAGNDLLKDNLKKGSRDYFVFYRPKDIVSGDYYWAHKNQNDEFILITADCTGHGVPGAFMSLLCISYLNEVVKEANQFDPGAIFNSLRTKIVNNFRVHENKERKDGMDAVICRFNFKTNTLNYAAANNPIVLIEPQDDGSTQLLELDYDKMPVGVSHNMEYKDFSSFSVNLKPGTCIYTFTDGFADQFGGPKGKKFMYKKLRELLHTIASLPMQEQVLILDKALKDWKGDSDQVDDILVIGVRV